MKKIFTFAALLMLGIMGANAQGQYMLGETQPTDGQQVTSVENITMTYGTDFKENKSNKLGDYSHYTQGTANVTFDDAGIPATGAFYKFEPVKNGTLEVGVVIGNGKDFYVMEDGVNLADDAFVLTDKEGNNVTLTNHQVASKFYGYVTVSVKGGSTYYLYMKGSKMSFYGFKYEVVEAPELEPGTATFDFTTDALHAHGAAANDQVAQIYNESFVVDNVAMQLVGGQIPVRCYTQSKYGNCVQFGKGMQMIIKPAVEGAAITKVEFTAAGGNAINVTPSSGTFADGVWTGNATSLRLNVESSAAYVATIAVSYDKATEESVEMPAVEYVDANGLAELAALDKGTVVRLTLTDAEVIAKSADGWSTAFIQDATGGAWVKYNSLVDRLRENTRLSGTFYVTKNQNSYKVTQISEAEEMPASKFEDADINELSMVEGTLAEVNVAANAERVVKIENAAFKVTNVSSNVETGELTQGDATILVNNGIATALDQLHKLQFEEGTEYANCTIVAILNAKNTKGEYQLLPLSIVENTAVGIQKAVTESAPAVIYNLQGQRISQMQRGLNIVNGKKVMF